MPEETLTVPAPSRGHQSSEFKIAMIGLGIIAALIVVFVLKGQPIPDQLLNMLPVPGLGLAVSRGVAKFRSGDK